jgi:hypothetical protein
MAQFPVSAGTGMEDGVNYLLSGPGGLGQNFAGFDSYSPVKYMTGNFRIPFSQATAANLYITGIGISLAEQIDDRTIKYTFTGAPLAAPPFNLGNALTVTGVVPAAYNSQELKDAGASIYQIGVIECTDTYVLVRTVGIIREGLGVYASGGSIEYNVMDLYNSTDCDVRVTVTGATDRVFVGGQLDQLISYEVTSGPADMTVYVGINRYKAFINSDPINPDYIFEFDDTVVEKAYEYTGLTGTGTLSLLETIFATIVDEPVPAYYRYILEVYFETVTGSIYVTQNELRLRSIAAQVVKQ